MGKKTIYLKDYVPPAYLIKDVNLHVDITDDKVRITALSSVMRNGGAHEVSQPLILDGESMALLAIAINDRPLTEGEYQLDAEHLIIPDAPIDFTLRIETEVVPSLNTSLMGLYQSSGNICTQCEAEGFRKITYFIDRPDNMAKFTTTIVADKTQYPVLLSNGNLIDQGEVAENRHWVTWEDPYPKPSYLFALVAGEFARVTDEFVTQSGRGVALNIYVQHHNAEQCEYALLALKNAMRWDEEVYGREYDLDVFSIVAVDDFNMGAMENKGLNIFNSKYVLANQNTATDTDYQAIEGIIGHEYFHNWSGNRVTCRDWFQLSLKEGFTVFRDQEFSADMASRAVKRIQDVNLLRTVQFREDASPVAHPVRPESYMEINNFYTPTVYNKGAEVVRMIYNLLGKTKFRAGTDLYFARHDGQAVRVEDFVLAMENVSDIDFSQFKRWYSQAGTPAVKVVSHYDAASRTYSLTFSQTCVATPESEAAKAPFHIPIDMTLLDQTGQRMPLVVNESESGVSSMVVDLRKEEETFVFRNIVSRPVPSLLRGFSAPIKLTTDLPIEDQYFLMAYDDDPYNRWNAHQQISMQIILANVRRAQKKQGMMVDQAYLMALNKILQDESADKSFLSLLLTLPNEQYIAENMAVIEPIFIHQARQFTKQTIAKHLEAQLIVLYREHNDSGTYEISAEAVGRRSFKNLCLAYLSELDKTDYLEMAWEQFIRDHNMTDVLAAFQWLVHRGGVRAGQAIQQFYAKWHYDTLVLDKWFSTQAVARLPGGVERIRTLMKHPQFNMKNPNKVRALIGAFSQANTPNFHYDDGSGYELVADCIVELDTINPQVAARLITGFSLWKRYDEHRQLLMRNQLERIIDRPKVSRDCYDVVQRLLA